MYSLIANFAKVIFIIFGRKKVIDKHHIPNDTGFVAACTHNSWLDVVALGTSLLPKQINFMAKKELFSTPRSDQFFRSINAFPVDRENPGPSSIKTPVKLLKEKKVIGIFPSGRRTTEDVPLKKGAATIANLAKVPILPAAYTGPTNIKELFSGKKMKVIFGEPIQLKKEDGTKKDVEALTQELSEKLNELQSLIK
ncbi:1-acyl-sn-glycerol-3-phosphate acyltransferase [Bacillus sp. 03113]|uniref:lysophospholipid acyltransferase family protein n=1 Tax=Bacillus sp. 03113 TaxID=2578211 RepID=UPI0011419940|nr:lysophospholipid acyltransferase family protein [Bacillus sp. 03113]